MLLALLLSLCAGELWILPGDWFSPRGELFVWQIRLPRTLAVLLVGAALAPATSSLSECVSSSEPRTHVRLSLT